MLVTAARCSAIPDETARRRGCAGSRCSADDAAAASAGPVAPAVVCFPFVGDLVGGSHRSAAKLIQNLDRKRYQPLVVLHRADGDVAALFRAEGIAFEPAPSERALEGRSVGADAAFLVTETRRLRPLSARRALSASCTPTMARPTPPGRCRPGSPAPGCSGTTARIPTPKGCAISRPGPRTG